MSFCLWQQLLQFGNQQAFKKLWQVCDEAFKKCGDVIPKAGKYSQKKVDVSVPLIMILMCFITTAQYISGKRGHSVRSVIFEDKVVVWSSEAIILRRERSSGKNCIQACLILFCCSSLAMEQILILWGSLTKVYSECGNEGILLLSDDIPGNKLTDIECFLATTCCK